MTAWDALESNFREAFVDYAESELADACIDKETPETFEQWTKAAQRQHKNGLKKRSIRESYKTVQGTEEKNQLKRPEEDGVGNEPEIQEGLRESPPIAQTTSSLPTMTLTNPTGLQQSKTNPNPPATTTGKRESDHGQRSKNAS